MVTKKKYPFNKIKHILFDKAITNKELANHLGTTEATVSRWVNNESQPNPEMFYRIADFLDCDLPDLIVSIKKN